MHGRGVIEYWRPDFSFKAFRYVEVTGYPQPIEEGQREFAQRVRPWHGRGIFGVRLNS